jgi:hypothetical protein
LVRGNIPDQDADEIVENVHASIMSDATLDSMVVDLNPFFCEWEFHEADKTLVVVTLQFKATYQTTLKSIA